MKTRNGPDVPGFHNPPVDMTILRLWLNIILSLRGWCYDEKLIGASRDGVVGVKGLFRGFVLQLRRRNLIRTSRDRGESDLTVDCHSNS